MQQFVITNVLEIRASDIPNRLSSMAKEIERRRAFVTLYEVEYELLKPYKDAKEDAIYRKRVEDMKKKKDRKERCVLE